VPAAGTVHGDMVRGGIGAMLGGLVESSR
jgi:hypothetical protein